MAKTIKEGASQFQPKSAKNITELKQVSVDLVMQTENGVNTDGEAYSYQYVETGGEKFRVPDSVLKDLKEILKKKPSLKNFAVSKTGEGRQTKYTVIPLD